MTNTTPFKLTRGGYRQADCCGMMPGKDDLILSSPDPRMVLHVSCMRKMMSAIPDDLDEWIVDLEDELRKIREAGLSRT